MWGACGLCLIMVESAIQPPLLPQKMFFNQNFSSLLSQWSSLVISLTTVDFCPIYPGGEIMSNAAMKLRRGKLIVARLIFW